MQLKNLIKIFTIPVLVFSFFSCGKETEEFTSASIAEYVPLTVGKYIIYRLDSTVFANQGRTQETHKYRIKHEVDAKIPDNLGRDSYRIIRYLSDSAGTLPWTPAGTYFITPLGDQLEVIEDNLRFIKLHIPFKLDFEWKGNKYLSADPYSSLYSFSNDDNMNQWDYDFDQYDATATIGTQTLNDVYTVFQIDESLNAPVTDVRAYGERTLATEKYAKGIGLVSRDYIMWEYQPNTTGTGGGYTIGFGIKMWMISYN